MYAIWCYLIYGFIPKWEIIKDGPITSPTTDAKIGWYYILQCKKTGRIKNNNVFC